MSDYLTYGVYRFFASLFSSLPKPLLKHLLNGITYLVSLFALKHNRIAGANLDLAFGQTKSEEEKRQIIKSSWQNLVYNMYEFIVMQKESFEEMEQKVEVENEEVIYNLLKEKRRIIIVSAHYGCWEFALPYFAMKYNPLTIISRKLNNPYINSVFMKARARQGLSMCEKEGAGMCMFRALKKGNVVALTIDQSINPKKSLDVNFFGHKATQVDSPVRLASKIDAAIVPMFVLNEGFENHKLVFLKPIEVKHEMSDNELQEASQELATIIENQIRERPGEWFWQHRRWKAYYPEMYQQ